MTLKPATVYSPKIIMVTIVCSHGFSENGNYVYIDKMQPEVLPESVNITFIVTCSLIVNLISIYYLVARPRWLGSDLSSRGGGFDRHRVSSILLWRLIMKYLLRLLSLVSGERMCTILVNRLEDKARPLKVRLGKLTALDITQLDWLGR